MIIKFSQKEKWFAVSSVRASEVFLIFSNSKLGHIKIQLDHVTNALHSMTDCFHIFSLHPIEIKYLAHKYLCILTFLRDLYKQNYLLGQLNPEIHNL